MIEKNVLKFKYVGQEFAKFLRSLEQFIQTVKGQNNFWQQNAFSTYSWSFLMSDEFKQLELKLEKILGFRNMREKLEKTFLLLLLFFHQRALHFLFPFFLQLSGSI